MATMYPSRQEFFPTPGEEIFYKFLQNAAGVDFHAWYSPDIENREPDFILYAPCSGLIVLEVKDWLPEQILEIDPKNALLQIGSRQEKRKQPFAQAREYVHNLLTLLRKHARTNVEGKPVVPLPVQEGVVFPHMRRDEFFNLRLDKVLDANKIFFWDELQPFSPLLADKSGFKFRSWLEEHFPPLFPFNMSERDIDWMRGCIFPIVRIKLPRQIIYEENNSRLQVLDREQENLARTLGCGSIVIEGPAGCGKTLVLTHQAIRLLSMNSQIKRVLFTCFNFSLVGYIKRLLSGRHIPLGPEHLEVVPFYSLCERILGEKLSHSGETPDYYSLIVDEVLERLQTDHPLKACWDAIFIDEGQDFSFKMIKVLRKLARPEGNFSIAFDENQILYEAGGNPWLDQFAKAPKRVRLDRQYRNAKEIQSFASRLIRDEKCSLQLEKNTKRVNWLLESDLQSLTKKIVHSICDLIDLGVPMNEIAILYSTGRMAGLNLPKLLGEELERAGILFRWSSRDTASKLHYDITTDSVTISTIHSAKGLDYGYVYLLGIENLDWSNAFHRHLAHVAITRGREKINFCMLKKSYDL